MDKSRFKRPPDVDEALSSMLWTPYDQTASNISSSSTDSLSDDEREREKRKLNRYSNPLPSSLNWWNSHVTNIHPTSLRYSFPFYGNYLPPLPHTTNNLGVMHNNNDRAIAQSSDTVGQTMNFTPSAASLSLAHSFTDDFYYYQHQQTVYKNHAAAAATTNCQSTTHKNLIDMTTHLVSSPATTTTSSSMTLPMQFNNQKSSSSSIWQHKKIGNSVETFMRHSTSKVTQPTERECLKHSSKTLPRQLTCANRAKQISHISDSNENAIASYCAINDGDSRQIIIKCNEYRNPLLNKKMNGADASCKNKNSNCSVSSHNRNDIMTSQNDHHQHYPQMPSSSSQQQHVQTQFINATIPVSLTTNNNATAASDCLASRNNVVVPCTSSVLLLSNDCQMTTTTATTENNNNLNNKLISVDVNCVNVECHKSKNIANENEIITQVHRATAADNEGNLIITSAIDLEKDSTKLSSEIITMREKRRRDRRDRRLARTRALNGTTNVSAAAEIVADSPRPPPYSSLPPQSSSSSSSIIPSIISTVPVDDTVRYMFSLPLVRRSTSDRSGKDCCGQWFNGPPLRFLVALVALGGVACTLGGATLGSIALAGSPTSHLTAGLLMTDLIKTGPVWSNFILLTTNFLKLFHMNYNLQAIEKLVKRVQTIYESSHIIHYHRYQKNFKINTITQILYPAAIYGAQLMFFLMPIIQNVVALSYGADHWERIIQHQLYFPYSLEPWHFYILTYFWIEYVAFFNNGYMVGNEILFDTLLVMISMEFDNLADEFKDFDFEHPDLKEFKKLKDRHSELLEISDEMNSNYNFPIMVTFLSSSVVICFSLLQVFSDNEKMLSFTTGSFYNLIKFGAYLNGAFLQIFLLSFFCEKLRTSSENIAKKIANSNWYMCKDIGMKKNYQMVLLKAQQPVELTALNFFGINIEIFTHVISTAYSYFGVLNHESSTVESEVEKHRVEKRGIFYPWLLYGYNAATGILVAIAIPLRDIDRNVFVSYNFEANYNMPNIPSDSVPGPILRWKLGSTYEDLSPKPDATPDDSIARNFNENSTQIETTTRSENEVRKRRNLADSMFTTRKGIYRLIESRLKANGFDGKKCLLRAICESAQNSFLEVNGVLGNILHIIFTPSTSIDENLPTEYNKAENLGYQNNCQKYIQRCEFSLLDAFSKLI
ncbi:hypothetical protein PVAND_000885 [Polypedilum vanderplanki]|uniref:Uncharacterized protein n=1 Tax=Polypedilum vanderplanki TaxID=319348 RepID=A0A9J6BLK3_POLVA|nr:hypothetical protein PVAND_000885 [Polypedilum vanderplanki]